MDYVVWILVIKHFFVTIWIKQIETRN
jgi:hypothetical protein